jgi:hypothetical protein
LVPSKVVKDYEFAFSSPGEDFRKHLKKSPGSFDPIAAKIKNALELEFKKK